MPINEYRCEKCGCVFEQLLYRSEDTDVFCPECQTRQVKKLLSSDSFMQNSLFGACDTGTTGGAGHGFG